MGRIALASTSRTDALVSDSLESFRRRVDATPPGVCPVAVQLSLLEASACQTCGKCVPCRDGAPALAKLLRKIATFRAVSEDLDRVRVLARTLRDTADCAIGYEAGRAVLEGLDAFADEYENHVSKGACAPGVAQKVPCEALCPAHVNVPAYIALAKRGDCAGAIAAIREDNPFPTACALVCEHPCETRCRRTVIDAPVNIRGIKKYVVDQVRADEVPVPARHAPSGKRVAIVGGGPSGLTCAYFLALMGHEVRVFEARVELGGMLRYGILAYRFPRERLDEDVRAILSVGGIEVETGCAVDAAKMREIRSSFDAAYVAIGAHEGKRLRMDHADARGVLSAVELLRGIGDGKVPDFAGKKVVVVGGGNVAMDCARTSVRAGATEVSVVYRRRLEDMTALPEEVESALAEGVEMITLEAPSSIEVDCEGEAVALVTQPQMIGSVKHGRPVPTDADKPRNRIEADAIVIAVGQDIESASFEEFGLRAEWGRLRTDGFLEAEGLEGLFAGGDCQTGPSSAVKAIAAGKVAARNIDDYLGFDHSLGSNVDVPAAEPNNRAACGRVNIAQRPARERKLDFEYVELPMSKEEAVQECGRCLRCDHYGCGALEKGRIHYD